MAMGRASYHAREYLRDVLASINYDNFLCSEIAVVCLIALPAVHAFRGQSRASAPQAAAGAAGAASSRPARTVSRQNSQQPQQSRPKKRKVRGGDVRVVDLGSAVVSIMGIYAVVVVRGSRKFL